MVTNIKGQASDFRTLLTIVLIIVTAIIIVGIIYFAYKDVGNPAVKNVVENFPFG